MTVAAPGTLAVVVETSNIPAGTTVETKFESRLDGIVDTQTGPIDVGNCDGAGVCTVQTTHTIATAGDYTVEARATFQTP